MSSVCPAGDEGWGRQDYRPPQPPVSPSGSHEWVEAWAAQGTQYGSSWRGVNRICPVPHCVRNAQYHIVPGLANTKNTLVSTKKIWPLPKKSLASTKKEIGQYQNKLSTSTKKKPSPHKLGLFSKDQDPKSCHRQTITGNKN